MATRIIAYCGIDCSDCDAYKATRTHDQTELERVATEWRKQFGWELTAASLACDGCLPSEGPAASYCAVCEIRACAIDRGLASCAYCDAYVCSTLQGQLNHAPELRQRLDAMRREFLEQA